MNLMKIPYFKYSRSYCYSERISINTNIETLIKRLKEGENLFDVIPNLEDDVFSVHNLESAKFQRREELRFNGTRFYSEEGYEDVGKLLVPSELVVTRDELVSIWDEKGEYMGGNIRKLFSDFPKVDLFYNFSTSSYSPLDKNKVLVLGEEQLIPLRD